MMLKALCAILLGLIAIFSYEQIKKYDCQKQHNVYRCEIVAVPVKESK